MSQLFPSRTFDAIDDTAAQNAKPCKASVLKDIANAVNNIAGYNLRVLINQHVPNASIPSPSGSIQPLYQFSFIDTWPHHLVDSHRVQALRHATAADATPPTYRPLSGSAVGAIVTYIYQATPSEPNGRVQGYTATSNTVSGGFDNNVNASIQDARILSCLVFGRPNDGILPI